MYGLLCRILHQLTCRGPQIVKDGRKQPQQSAEAKPVSLEKYIFYLFSKGDLCSRLLRSTYLLVIKPYQVSLMSDKTYDMLKKFGTAWSPPVRPWVSSLQPQKQPPPFRLNRIRSDWSRFAWAKYFALLLFLGCTLCCCCCCFCWNICSSRLFSALPCSRFIFCEKQF